MDERRRSGRKSPPNIPDRFSKVIVQFESGDSYEGLVNDISQRGMSIDLPILPNKIRDIMVTIYSLDKSISTTQEIANFSSSNGGSRIGLLFDSDNVFFLKS
ncbi:MAG: PilZ domain-containing protein [Spirochaetales bacterium]|nr:PilZ domain-containing protein [Spirochaetales bacterium]